jgi:hypothetical protein
MKHRAIRRAMPLAMLGLSLFCTTAQAIDTGKNRYQCQVTTVNNLQGYVGVMSDTLQGAIAMAGRFKEAVTRLDTKEAVKQVVQCVQWPNGKFTDAGFQVWVDEVLPK